MSQAHFRLYHKDVVFASLIPAEEWLYDWYSRCGYTRNITCTLPPADVENMDFSTSIGGNVQRIAYFYMTKKVLILSRKIIVYHSLLSQMLALETKDIPGMIRIINAEKALQLFANRHPEHTENIRVYNDSDIPMNNIYFEIKHGHVVRTNHPLPDTRSLTITELADYIFKNDNLEMNLMLN